MKNRIAIIVGVVALVGLLAVMRNRGGTPTNPPPKPEESVRNPEASVFALQAADTASDDVRVTLHSLPTAGPVVTIITEMDYDTDRLKMKSCDINPQIGERSAPAKVLHLAEPAPGLVRAVVAGSLAELPQAADVLACDFAVLPNAPDGPTTLRVHGQVADMTFEDRSFSAEKTIVIRN